MPDALSKKSDPGRTRTCNLWFRRPTPYPLGHRAMHLLHCSFHHGLARLGKPMHDESTSTTSETAAEGQKAGRRPLAATVYGGLSGSMCQAGAACAPRDSASILRNTNVRLTWLGFHCLENLLCQTEFCRALLECHSVTAPPGLLILFLGRQTILLI